MTAVAGLLVAMVLAPLLALTAHKSYVALADAACAAGGGPAPTADGSPSILGPSTLTAAQIAAWWQTTGAPDPLTTIGLAVTVLAQDYVDIGAGDGVRGDIAFAQAIVETGYFTSPAATRNNFAGIGITGPGVTGTVYPTQHDGVTAHIQLLDEVVNGNAVTFAEPKIAPDWGGKQVSTWAGLTGNWATDPAYWTVISGIYDKMLNGRPVTPGSGGACTGNPVSVGALAHVWPQVLAFLTAQLGKPYRWGATGPDSYDCSGLTQTAYAQVGIRLPRTSEEQWIATKSSALPFAQVQPGFLLFSEPDRGTGLPGHVRIYIGNNQAIAAPFTGANVRVEPVGDPSQLIGVSIP